MKEGKKLSEEKSLCSTTNRYAHRLNLQHLQQLVPTHVSPTLYDLDNSKKQ